MVKNRRGSQFVTLFNKKGHPIYSKEDIREQYCINKKELEVLEHKSYGQQRLFGCLSSSHISERSPCTKKFFTSSCIQKRKSSSELDEDSDINNRSIEFSSILKVLILVSRIFDSNKNEESDDSDGGFKRRGNVSCRSVVADQRNTWTIDDARRGKETLDNESSSVNYISQHSNDWYYNQNVAGYSSQVNIQYFSNYF